MHNLARCNGRCFAYTAGRHHAAADRRVGGRLPAVHKLSNMMTTCAQKERRLTSVIMAAADTHQTLQRSFLRAKAATAFSAS